MSTIDAPGCDRSLLAPLTRWHEHDQRGHVVQFYSEDAALLESIGRFAAAALDSRDSALVIATKAHLVGLAQQLTARGCDFASAIQQGRYIALDAAETLSKFMSDGRLDAQRFNTIVGATLEAALAAAESGHGRVAAFGEMVALLWAQGNAEAALELEELWNNLGRTHSFSLRCGYPITGFNREKYGDAFLKICGAHSSVIPAESYTSLRSEEDRLRSITHLQQKAQALEGETAGREQAESALRRKEAELADVLENAPQGALQTGPEQKVLWANNALLSLLGYAREEYVGHPVADFYADRKTFEEYWRKLMQGEDVYDYPAELRCKDGSVKQVLIQANGLWSEGEFIHTRCFVRDVTEERRAEQALRESEASLRQAKDKLQSLVEQRTAALRNLSSRILTLQDDERRRIARELHDSLGQYLVGLKLNLNLLRRLPQQPELWSEATSILEQCMSEVRTLSSLLHPPMIEELGLVPAAEWFVDGLSSRTGIRFSLDAQTNMPRLPAAVEMVLFRGLQEALANVHRHSRATVAEVRIHQEGQEIILEVHDDGRGVPAEACERFRQTGAGMGIGLTGMRERVRELGGTVALESGRESGTSLRIALPLASRAPIV